MKWTIDYYNEQQAKATYLYWLINKQKINLL